MEQQTSPAKPGADDPTCAYCHDPYIALRGDQKCCSKQCRIDYERQKGQIAKQRQPHSLSCNWCDNKFESIRNDREYCSTACQQAFNNFWKGYGPKLGKALTKWRVRKIKGAFTDVCRLFSEARAAAKEKKAEKNGK